MMPSLAADEWKEMESGIPSTQEPFIRKYVEGREKLIREEKKQRGDAAFRAALSPIARDACAIVERIRRTEMETVWTAKLEEELAHANPSTLYPGMMFNLAKEKMEQTKLYEIVKKMPKGALLHAHMDAMVDFDWLFETMMREPGMCIRCPTELHSEEGRHIGMLEFRFRTEESIAKLEDTDIWSSNYTLSTLVPVTKAAETFPNGGRAGFISWLKDRFTITRDESLNHHHGGDHVWRRFQSVFHMINGIAWYEPIFRLFVPRMLSLLHADGVKWVDLRAAFTFEYCRAGSEVPETDYLELFRWFGEEIGRFKESEEGKGFWGARMIWTGIRRFDTRLIVEDMDRCLTTKLAYPDLICGYDLVGQEDLGRPLKDVLPELFWFRKQCAEEGVEIPFFFHAGETLGDGDDTDQNLFDAILLGTRRIGHGFSLYKHPLLCEMVREKQIMVESCPISNEVLRLCASIMSHPLPALLARGVSCSLCNDDPAILGQDTAGSTHDFWQALQGWENLGLAGLGSLAQNSIKFAAFEDQDSKTWLQGVTEGALGQGIRGERLREWGLEWEKFCLWVVTEYDEDAELNGSLKAAKIDA